jgi:protein TonB
MRLLWVTVCAVVVGTGCVAIGQDSDTAAQPATREAHNSPCKPPKAVFQPPASPPASWERKGPKSAQTLLEITVDKKGFVHDPVVIRSGGDDVDKEAINAVRRWTFTPANCGKGAVEVKIRVDITVSLR